MEEMKQQFLTGERALFQGHDLRIMDTTFADGESPLKESRNIELTGSMVKWKYPLWYSKSVTVKDSTWFEMARAGVWYTDEITVRIVRWKHRRISAVVRMSSCGMFLLPMQQRHSGVAME